MTTYSSPMIAVHDVPATSAWYQGVLGCHSDMQQGHPHRQDYDRLVDANGKILISFHSWAGDEADTPVDLYLASQNANLHDAPRGHGVIVSFVLQDLDQAVARARNLGAELVGEMAVYPDRSRSQLVRDPDGYMISLGSGPDIAPAQL
jgi:catechol 2,3-dioxygenase-like lactoylglutathione lyase family enzyme